MKRLLNLILVGAVCFTSCSKSNTAKPQPTNTVIITGTSYNTVSIGTQTWTDQDYKGAGGYTDTLKGVLTGYSHLYTYDEALSVKLPTGWRLPTSADYTKLLLSIGGTTDSYGDGTASGAIAGKLVSSAWPYANGSNSTLFSAGPIGYYNSAASDIQGQDETEVFWTSTPVTNSTMKYGCGIDNYESNSTRTLTAYLDYYRPADELSLRFVKDN